MEKAFKSLVLDTLSYFRGLEVQSDETIDNVILQDCDNGNLFLSRQYLMKRLNGRQRIKHKMENEIWLNTEKPVVIDAWQLTKKTWKLFQLGLT